MALPQDETTTEQPSIDYEALGLEPVDEEELFGFRIEAEAPETPKAETPEIDYEALGLEPVSEKELFGFEMPKEEPEAPSDWDTLRGLEVSMRQVPQLAYGVAGLVGATSEEITGYGEALRDWGFRGYKEWEESMEPISKETDDITVAWDRAKNGDVGALVDWAQYGIGYGLGQLGETAAVAILGGIAGGVAGAPAGGVGAAPAAAGGAIVSAASKQGFKALAKNLVEKAIAKQAANIATREAEKRGIKLTAEQITKEASQAAIKRRAAKEIGSDVAVFGNAIGMQLGSIYGEAESKAQAEGRDLTGYDLARVWGTGLATGGLEGVVDKFGLDLLKGKLSAALPEGRLAGAAVAGGVGTLGEAGTEAIQTVGERIGAGKDILSDEAINEYINAAALGGLAGGGIGGVGGFISGNQRENAAAKAKVAAEASKNIAPESSKLVSDQADAVINEVAQETPDERVARLQAEAQAAREITLEEEAPVAGLPPERIKSARWFESAARNRLKELQDKDDAGVEDFTIQERDEFEFLKTSPTPEQVAERYGYGVAPAVEPTAVTTTTPPTTPAVAEPAPVEPKPTLTPPPTVTEPTAPTTLQPDLLTPEGKTGEERSTIDQENRRKTEEFINGLEDGEYQVFDSSGEKNGIAKVRTNKSGKKVVEYVTDDGKQFIGDAKSLVPELNFARFTDATGKEGFDRGSLQKITPVAPTPEAAPAAVEPTPVAQPPVTPQLEPLRRVARAEQTEEDVAGLVDAGFVEVYNGQPVITQAGIEALPEAERPRLTPEARKIQIDTGANDVAAEAISKNLRIGVDQIDPNVRMPAGWTLVEDVYVPPTKMAKIETFDVEALAEVDEDSDVFADVIKRKDEAKAAVAQKPEGSAFATQEEFRAAFDLRGEGHGRFATRLDLMVADGVITSEGRDLIMAVIYNNNTNDDFLKNMEMGSMRARATRSYGFGGVSRQTVQSAKGKAIGYKPLLKMMQNARQNLKIDEKTAQTLSTFWHEFGHAGYYSLLDSSQKAKVSATYKKTTKAQRIKFFESGVAAARQGDVTAQYYSKSETEWFAQSFAEYVLTQKSDQKALVPIFESILNKIKNIFEKLFSRKEGTPELNDIFEYIIQGKGYGSTKIWWNGLKLSLAPAVYGTRGAQPIDPNFSRRLVEREKQNRAMARKSISAPEVREARREPAITPQQDRDYLDAVERGDLDAASRVVEDAATKAGFTSPTVFHGSIAKGVTRFDVGQAVEVEGGIFFTTNEDVAAQYTFERAYGDIISDEPLGDVTAAKLRMDNPFEYQAKGKIVDAVEMQRVIDKAKADGFDGVIIRNIDDSIGMTGDMGDVYVVFNGNQIKSADPVTYDDQGNIIPLSQRFQPEQADIRYARRQLRELFKAGRPIDDYEGRAPSVNWDAVDMYGVKWDEQTVADFVESPHQFIYSAMLDSGDLTPKVVEMETANEIERMSEDQIRSEYPDEFIDEDVNWRDVRSRMAEESRNSWEYKKQDMANPTGRGYPPAVVRRTGENTFEVVDGNHRIDLWQEQGFDVVPVWVIDDYLFREDKKRKTPLDTSSYNAEERQKIRNFLELLSQRQSNEGVDPNQFMTSYRTLPEEFKRAIEYSGRATLYRGTESDTEGKTVFPETMTFTRNEGYAKFMGTFQITNKGLPSTGTIDSQKVVQMLNRRANKQFEKEFRDAGWSVGDDEGEVIIVNDPRERMRQALRVGRGRAGMEQASVEARLQELGFPTGGIIRVVNQPDADFEGRTIILDGKVTGIELNASAMRDNATIDRVLNHEFAESANADGALNKLVERLTPKEKKEINDTITRLRYEERARTSEEAARAIETLAEAWKGRGFFTRAVARVEAWASKLGFKLTRRAAEYIAARNLADINAGFRAAYNQFINVRGEVREGRAEDQAVVDADMGRRSQTELTPQEIDQLEKGEKIRVYRAMQIIDGKLYPPMSALVGGKLRKPTEIGAWEKAEERPDLLDKKGKFVLQKGNKTTVPAAYNPYFHTSSSPLNDQFSSAYKRDNLVTVEVEIPASELTSGYKAEGAKDAVGEVRWNAGPVSSKLPADKKRRVFLSRYAKVVRIVPDSEVAEVISGLLDGTNLSIPENTVTPSLRSELEKRGVAVTPRPARGQEIRESRREPEAIPTFTEGTPEAATLKEMEASMAKVDAASEAKGGKPETYKISEIASVWMDSGLGERELQDAITEYTNLTPANAARVARAIAKQYGLQQQIAETGAVIAEPAPEAEGAPRKTSVQRLIEQAVGVRRPIVKLEVPEKTALKDQIRLKAREARETRKARKEAARDLAEAITQYVKENQLRGPVRARQTMSLAKQALKLDVNNEKAVDRYIMYVERVVENANYDKDLSDAKALRKRAKEMAKKKNIGPEQKKVLEAIGNINPSLLDNPFEYNILTERYLLGFLPVTSRQYSVMPDAEARQYLESLEEQMKRNQAELDRAELERFFETQAGFAEQRGLSLEEAQNLLNEDGDISQIIQDYELEKRKATEEMLLNLAQNAQRTLKTYDDSANTARQRELISFMNKVKLESITSEEKKRFIRFANNILANGETFGVEQFEAVAKAQERSAEALKDKRLAQKMNAWIGPLSGGSPAEMVKKLSLATQSEVDTLKNVFGREAVGVFRRVLGLLDLDVAQTASTTEKEKVANKVGDFYKGLKKKYGEDSVGRESNIFTTAAAYFIQAEGNKTQEESIAYRRRLWNENIEELRKSERTEDREEAEIKQRALDALTGNNNAEILNSLRSINPAAYEQLMWWKDQMHPEYKPFLKDHVENFRNQANNYDNIDYLSIHYKWDQSPELPSDLDAQEFDDVSYFRIKQAANSIKRKDHPSLPVNPKTGVKANIDVNFGYNQYNALTEQLEKAYTAPAWEAVYAFTRLPDFEQIMGGKTNADFVKNILRNIKATRTRKAMLDDENQVIGGAVALTRRISTQAALGGVLQPFRQIPDQLFKLFATTGRWDLVSKNIVQTLTNYSATRNNPLLNKLPIGRRGDARAGSQFAAEFNELARKVEVSVTNKQWTKYKELMTQMGEFWMTPLRGSDTWIAKVSWMSYYESELNKKGIKMESWEREAELFETDPARQEAASQAEFLVDFYAGASDPTKMAALSKQGNNGWREFSKLIFLSLNSFALQQKSALISDARDLVLRSGSRKDALAGVVGTIGGMVAFHGMRIFIIGGLIYPAAMMVLKGIFGIDMDEPDEEEQEKQLRDNWRKMKASIYSNIVAGGAGQFFEQKSIDAFNRTMYLWDSYINPDEMMDDKGEFISFSKYEKEKSPFYRFRSYSRPEFTFGLADVLTEQAQRSVDQTAQLLSDEEMSLYTGNEQAYALFATGVEWAYFFRLMDTDLKRITTKLKNDMDKQAKEREAEIRAIRNR